MFKKKWLLLVPAALALSACSGVQGLAPAQAQATASARAPLLPQSGNPINSELSGYNSWLSKNGDKAAALAADKALADNIVSWQMPYP